MRFPDLPDFHDGTWNFPRLLDYEKVLNPYVEGLAVPEGYSPAYVDLQYREVRVYCWEKVDYTPEQLEPATEGLGAGFIFPYTCYYNRRRLDLEAWERGEIIWGEPKATHELLG